MLSEVPLRIGSQFSWYSPLTLGLMALGCGVAAILLGFFSTQKRLLLAAISGIGVAGAAWIGIHTYMYLVIQYLFPALFPFYLAVAIAVGISRYRAVAFAIVLPIVFAAATDVVTNVKSENSIEKSGVLSQLEIWREKFGVTRGFGHYPSNYNLMFASGGRFILPYREDPERFKYFQTDSYAAKRIVYIYHRGDREPKWDHAGYRVLDSATMGEGFEGEVLEKIFK